MKKTTLILTAALAALAAGCAAPTRRTCAVLVFGRTPSLATQDALAATTKDDPAAVRAWFAAGHRDFVVNDDRPELDAAAVAAALADGAELRRWW